MSTLKLNKRGISSVISTVLLIAIAVVSAGLLWQVVSLNLDLSPEISCTDLKLNPSLEIKDVCYNAQTKQLQVIVDRSINSPAFTSLEFSVPSNTNANTLEWACGPSCGTCQILNNGESKKYFFSVPDITQTNSLTISANSCAIISTTLQDIKNC